MSLGEAVSPTVHVPQEEYEQESDGVPLVL